MVLLFRLENGDLVLLTQSEMHHFRLFIFLIVVFAMFSVAMLTVWVVVVVGGALEGVRSGI